ncbi:hypothetical protein FACS1894192_12900 [Bacilli bacterium]|nr:hypothetical protein FACS1894192_12900 [Bacilli bacterium]
MNKWIVFVNQKPVVKGDDYLKTLSNALEMGYQLKDMTILNAGNEDG